MVEIRQSPRSAIWMWLLVSFLLMPFVGGFVNALGANLFFQAISTHVLLGIIFLLDYRYRNCPILYIDEQKIRLREEVSGNIFELDDLPNYTLVYGSNFIAFRQDRKNDILVNKSAFSRGDWEAIKKELRKLPFGKID